MLRKVGLVLAVLALFTMAGGHWAVLQTVAWAEMLHDYQQRSGSIAVAVGQTFDGQHPCELCREIQAAKSNERKGSSPASSVTGDAKLKALLADSAILPSERAPAEISFPRALPSLGASRTEQPPTPPPRRWNIAA